MNSNNKSIFRTLLLIVLSFISIYTFSGNLYINEILASNTAYLAGYNKNVDWIEIYNSNSKEIDISGFYLSDNKEKPEKWVIPSGTKIAANGFKIIFGDELDSGLHTNFRLSIEGEYIGLYNMQKLVIDSFTYKVQRNNISYGRNSSNLGLFGYYQTPTPNKSNGSNDFTSMVERPVFSIKGGFFKSKQKLIITTSSGSIVRYTVNGSEPSSTSLIYSDSITIDSTISIRAAAFQSGLLTSEVVTQTYFINVSKKLPVISIVTDPDNLFSNQTGIYVIGTNGIQAGCSSTKMNLNRDWERPVNIELYDENGTNQINQGAGVKIFGGCSRQRFALKSLAVFARKEYGKNDFNYKLFKTRSIDKFESFLLRSSSDDQQYTMFRDGLGHTLVSGLKVETQAYQPAVVYINGQYWGIHNIREKYNEAYFNEHYNIKEDNINLLENNKTVIHGSANHYSDMMSYLKSHNSDVNIYEYMNTQMDIESYLDYMCSQIYLGADDWPGNNIKYWRASIDRYNRWRWVCYDMDQVVMLNNSRWNSMLLATKPYGGGWPNPAWSVELFNNMLKIKKFKEQFIQHMMFLMNTSFSSERILEVIDSMQNNIIEEMPYHIARWGGILEKDPRRESWVLPIPTSMDLWESKVQIMRQFATDRPDTSVNMLARFFKLTDTVRLTVNALNDTNGYIYLGYKRIFNTVHQGKYFAKTAFSLKAIPKPGYRFVKWNIIGSDGFDKTIQTPELSYVPNQNTSFAAVFEKYNIEGPTVVLNEINYHSSNYTEAGDWVEIYNRTDEQVDISGWLLKDGKDKNVFEIPYDTKLSGRGYYVLCEDTAIFKNKFYYTSNILGNLGYSLDNGGELIRLFDAVGNFVDSVHYNDTIPWPVHTDGEGRTLALISPELNNDLAQNWSDTYKLTPGDTNVVGAIEIPVKPEEPNNIVNEIQTAQMLYQNYPNPCNSVTVITYNISTAAYVTLSLSDMYGRVLKRLVDCFQTENTYKVTYNLNNLSRGVYYYTLSVDNKVVGSKIMLVTE